MKKQMFEKHILKELEMFKNALSNDEGDWIVKGFIDIYENIYTISIDTKVISKIIELLLFPLFIDLCQKYGYELQLSDHQNHYPDMTFIAKDGTKFALDIKSTYRTKNKSRVNGFTLGAFTGYFRKRDECKNIKYPYSEYSAHYVLGVIYTRNPKVNEREKHKLIDLQSITSVIRNFEFIFQEKWKIASDKPGSGNTKNIGSEKKVNSLLEGNGTFATYSESVFDDYWRNFLTKSMAKEIDSDVSYTNIEEYLKWKSR